MSSTLKLNNNFYWNGYDVWDSTRADRTSTAATGNALRLRIQNNNMKGSDSGPNFAAVKSGWVYEMDCALAPNDAAHIIEADGGSDTGATGSSTSGKGGYWVGKFPKRMSIDTNVDNVGLSAWRNSMAMFVMPVGGTLDSSTDGTSGMCSIAWQQGASGSGALPDWDWSSDLGFRLANCSGSTRTCRPMWIAFPALPKL